MKSQIIPSQRQASGVVRRSLVQRAALAGVTYVLGLMLLWATIYIHDFQASLVDGLVITGLVIVSQVTLFGLIALGFTGHLRDPYLTEAQVMLGLGWQTFLIFNLEAMRGTFLAGYLLILIAGLFHLSSQGFIRCAVLAFVSFVGLNLWEFKFGGGIDPKGRLLQVFVLFVTLGWLCLYARYVQVTRQRMRQRRIALQAHQHTLRAMMMQLEDLAATDELTGLYNRRHFLNLASRQLASLDSKRVHGLALIDLDHFKRINDEHGHAAGDRVLRLFAQIVSAFLRENDVLARYGGEEFVLLLPNSSTGQLHACCERLRMEFARCELDAPVVRHFSLSVGMTLLRSGDDLDAALQRADKALYSAKHGGRNGCVAAWE